MYWQWQDAPADEFGVKVSVVTTLKRSKGGQFALYAKALPGNPYDGHTLAAVIPNMETTMGNEIGRFLTDAGYRVQMRGTATSFGSSPPVGCEDVPPSSRSSVV